MSYNVIIFEDDPRDQKEFKKLFRNSGHSTLILPNNAVNSKNNVIKQFQPSLVIIDCKFKADIDGLEIVKYFDSYYPDVPVIICTYLWDIPEKRDWVKRNYYDKNNVKKVFGKRPFPTLTELINN